jgi:hypothetical protein
MVSAGLDTVPGNLIMGIAYLSSEHGQEIQKRAYEEIMKVYPNGEAWEKGLLEEKVPYVTAFVREVLRFFTVIPICLPRTSIKDIEYKGAIIPAGTTFYMVSSQTRASFCEKSLTTYRTPGQLITTKPTSKNPIPSLSNAISRTPKEAEPLTTHMEQDLVCVPVPILRTENSTRRSSEYSLRSKW